MRRAALGADERPQAALVRGADRVVRRLADDDPIRFRLLPHDRSGAAPVDFLVGDERKE